MSQQDDGVVADQLKGLRAGTALVPVWGHGGTCKGHFATEVFPLPAGRRKGPLLSPLMENCDLTVAPVGDSRKFKAQHIWSERSDQDKVGQNSAALQPWLEVSEVPPLDLGTLPKTPVGSHWK